MIPTRQLEKLLRPACIFTFGYCILFSIFYASDPLALSPQLDAKENLQLAKEIAAGTMAKEPFYRAVFYPFLLSLAPFTGGREQFGLIMGLFFHLLNGLLIFGISKHIWSNQAAGWVACILYLLNPASLFYAVQILDITLAITFCLGSTFAYLQNCRSIPFLISAGLLIGLSVVTRPHFLPLAIVLPGILYLLQRPNRRAALVMYATLIGVLLCQGAINARISGEFRILPWQGSYNLYAANRSGANGLYYKQTIDVSSETYSNPARAESEILYQRETGAVSPLSISEMDKFWRNKAMEVITGSADRIIGLWAYKAYAIVNSYEQYNNLTFSYHKQRLQLLNLNPHNYGILIILATLGGCILLRVNRNKAIGILLIIIFYSSSLLIYYASARFRLPIVPFLAILGGGCLFLPDYVTKSRTWPVATAGIIAAFLTFSSFAGIKDTSTFIQDDLLMANAHAELNNDFASAKYALNVLRQEPRRKEAQRIYAISYFNLKISGNPHVSKLGSWEEQKAWITQTSPTDPVQDAILGIFLWKWGNSNTAKDLWRNLVETGNDGSALASACLTAISGDQTTDPLAQALRDILING